jgi:hypothetical protein
MAAASGSQAPARVVGGVQSNDVHFLALPLVEPGTQTELTSAVQKCLLVSFLAPVPNGAK